VGSYGKTSWNTICKNLKRARPRSQEQRVVEIIDSRQEFDYLLSVKLEKSMDSTAKAKRCFNKPHANSMIAVHGIVQWEFIPTSRSHYKHCIL